MKPPVSATNRPRIAGKWPDWWPLKVVVLDGEILGSGDARSSRTAVGIAFGKLKEDGVEGGVVGRWSQLVSLHLPVKESS